VSTYSKYWRVQCSPYEATELALGLRALRKVAGSLGRNVKPVFWRGMPSVDENGIFLEPGVSGGKYPISPERFDLLVGMVIHEGLSSMEWREWVIGKVHEAVAGLPDALRAYAASFTEAAEDIYVSRITVPEAYSVYLSNLWQAELTREVRDPRLPPSAASLAHLWKARALGGTVSGPLHPYYVAPLDELDRCSRGITEAASLATVAQRRERRLGSYLSTWRALQRIFSEWETFEASPNGIGIFDEEAPPANLEDRDAGEGGKEPFVECGCEIDAKILEEVSTRLQEGELTLTQSLVVAVEDPEAGAMPTVIRRGVARSDVKSDPAQVRRLKRIFQEQESALRRARRRGFRRGVLEGKLDARRLHRAMVDGKVFRSPEPNGRQPFWQICVVADASASMAGKGTRERPWAVVERALGSLVEAGKGSRNRIDVYAYHEEKNRCALTLLNHDGQFYTVAPVGRTPSGQSILGAATMLRRGPGKRMIIHVTDGASNCGSRLKDAIDTCRENDIELFTIGCGCTEQTRDFLKGYFPPCRLHFLETSKGLPEGLERLLRQQMLAGLR
jgi:hypothetical protein